MSPKQVLIYLKKLSNCTVGSNYKRENLHSFPNQYTKPKILTYLHDYSNIQIFKRLIGFIKDINHTSN